MTAILAAKRTAVVPRGGAFARLNIEDLAAPVIAALLDQAGIAADAVDEIIVSCAMYDFEARKHSLAIATEAFAEIGAVSA